MKLKFIFFLMAMFVCGCVSAKPQAGTDNRTKVLFQTDKGNITIALYDETPKHKANFIKLVKQHYYDGLLFHRVIKDFMIQAGDPKSRNAAPNVSLGDGDTGYTVPAEFCFPKLFHKRGAVAAAREGDNVNPKRESSGGQFYIVWGQNFSTADMDAMAKAVEQQNRGAVKFTDEVKKEYVKYGGTPHLDGAYTVFGEVIDGMKVVDKIQWVQTNDEDRPLDDVHIIKAEIIK